MYSINWGEVQNQIQYITAFLSFTLNSLLILLILKKSPKKVGAYKYLMICVSVFEMFYSVMDVVVSPVFHSYGSSFIVYVDLRRTIFARETVFMLHSTYCGCFGFSMAVFGMHFIYRYLVATGNRELARFNNWRIISWLIIPLIYGVVWGLTAYNFCAPNDAANEYVKNAILEIFDIKIEDLTYVGAYLYPMNEHGQHYVETRAAIALTIFFTEVTTSLITIFYFATKCFVRISSLLKSSAFSTQHAGLQSQLFHALVTQTLIPVFLMHIPASAMFFFTVLDLEMGMACGIVSITIALYPAIDPLPTIFIVKNYRKGLYEYYSAVRNFVRCQTFSKSVGTSSNFRTGRH